MTQICLFFFFFPSFHFGICHKSDICTLNGALMQQGARSQPRCSATVVSLKAFEPPTRCLTFPLQRQWNFPYFRLCDAKTLRIYSALFLSVIVSESDCRLLIKLPKVRCVRNTQREGKRIQPVEENYRWWHQSTRVRVDVAADGHESETILSEVTVQFKELKLDTAQPSMMVFAVQTPVWTPAALL